MSDVKTIKYPCIIESMPEADYHAREEVSSSQLKHLLKSPFHYAHNRTVKVEPTPAMLLGSAVHTAVLEPEKFKDLCTHFNGHRRGKEYTEFYEENKSKIIFNIDEWQKIQAMRDSLLHSECSAPFFKFNALDRIEPSLFWQDAETGIACRGRLDLVKYNGVPILIDVKTTFDASPMAFGRQALDLGYHISMGAYQKAWQAVFKEEIENVLFIAVENKEPYVTAVYQMDERTLSLGRETHSHLLRKLKHSQEQNQWPAYGDRPLPLEAPEYLLNRMEQSYV